MKEFRGILVNLCNIDSAEITNDITVHASTSEFYSHFLTEVNQIERKKNILKETLASGIAPCKEIGICGRFGEF